MIILVYARHVEDSAVEGNFNPVNVLNTLTKIRVESKSLDPAPVRLQGSSIVFLNASSTTGQSPVAQEESCQKGRVLMLPLVSIMP
jgi:hypothetical protein